MRMKAICGFMAIVALGTGVRADDGPPLESVTFNLGDFQLVPFAGPTSFALPVAGNFVGWSFEGTVAGISGNQTWASDMRMTIRDGGVPRVTIGGFPSNGAWAFDGNQSNNDGTYLQPFTAFETPQVFGGLWTVEFEHAWFSGSAATMSWSNVMVTLYGDAGFDCNRNGIGDGLELKLGLLADCNQNGVADICEFLVGYASPPQAPFSVGHPLIFSVADPAMADETQESVFLDISVRGAFGSPSQFVAVVANGATLGVVLLSSGEACPDDLQRVEIRIPTWQFNLLRASGVVTIELVPSGAVGACVGSSAQVVMSYVQVPPDCDGDGVWDACQIYADPLLDCDGNGQLDACELQSNPGLDCDGNGVIDACELLLDPSLDCDGDGIFDACQMGFGLVGRYYANITLSGSFVARIDPAIFFNLNSFQLPAGIPSTDFTVRWIGSIVAPKEGVTELAMRRDDGVRLFLDGAKLIDRWTAGGGDLEVASVTLSPGEVRHLRIEYLQLGGGGLLEFMWRRAGGPLEPVPSSALRAIHDGNGDGQPDICGAIDCNGNFLSDAVDIATGVSFDCNGNGIPDECELALDPSLDLSGNGIIDACSLARGDLDLNGVVNGSDLAVLLLLWGTKNPAFGDLNGDGVIDGMDLGILLLNWGVLQW